MQKKITINDLTKLKVVIIEYLNSNSDPLIRELVSTLKDVSVEGNGDSFRLGEWNYDIKAETITLHTTQPVGNDYVLKVRKQPDSNWTVIGLDIIEVR